MDLQPLGDRARLSNDWYSSGGPTVTTAGSGFVAMWTHYAADFSRGARSIGIPAVGDLVSYELSDRDSFVGFMETHGLDHDRLRKAAGI